MGYIVCTCCKEQIKKWDYEISRIQNKDTYTCKKCKHLQSKITKICPICKNEFTGTRSSIGKQTTCSYSCSNKMFRTEENNGNWNKDSYRSTCFLHHNKKCIICDEDKIVTVHHYNKNHKDNNPTNLVPLCPTHHHYLHSKYSNLISDRVDEYVRNFKNNFNG